MSVEHARWRVCFRFFPQQQRNGTLRARTHARFTSRDLSAMASVCARRAWTSLSLSLSVHSRLGPRFLVAAPFRRGVADSQAEVQPAATAQTTKKKPMSLAMQYYLKKKQAHDAFMSEERAKFEMGKKHLANMMGVQADEMTQQDIDQAIEYLFPSGLRDEEARPLMKPPEDVFPRQKDPEFNDEGRPYHPFFYTLSPNYARTLFDARDSLEKCQFLGDRLSKQGQQPDPTQRLTDATLADSRWLNKQELEKALFEDLKEAQYKELMDVLTTLLAQPCAYKYKEFVFKFRVNTDEMTSKKELPEPMVDDQGRTYVESLGQRRSSCAKVRVTKPGTGRFTVTHIDYPDHADQDITYFYGLKERQQVLYPLQFTKLLGRVDVDCLVDAGGAASQAGAIRYATALCLRNFVDEQTCEEMSLAGLITQDIRVGERNQPGRRKARKKFTWKKR